MKQKKPAKKFSTFRPRRAEGENYPIEKRKEVSERMMPQANVQPLGGKRKKGK